MKLLQKRGAACAVMVLCILTGIALGRARAPAPAAGPTSNVLLHNEGGVISKSTLRYLEDLNAALFPETGAEIVVDVVRTTPGDIADYAEDVFSRQGIGSRERDNGLLLVLALENEYHGAPDGDYYLAWGSGFTASQQERLDDVMWRAMEADFAAGRYDEAVRATASALAACVEDFYPAYGGGGSALVLTAVVLLLLLAVLVLTARPRRGVRPWVLVPGPPRPPWPPRPPRPPAAASRPPSFHHGGSFGGGSGRRPSGGAGRRSPARRSGGGGRRR